MDSHIVSKKGQNFNLLSQKERFDWREEFLRVGLIHGIYLQMPSGNVFFAQNHPWKGRDRILPPLPDRGLPLLRSRYTAEGRHDFSFFRYLKILGLRLIDIELGKANASGIHFLTDSHITKT